MLSVLLDWIKCTFCAVLHWASCRVGQVLLHWPGQPLCQGQCPLLAAISAALPTGVTAGPSSTANKKLRWLCCMRRRRTEVVKSWTLSSTHACLQDGDEADLDDLDALANNLQGQAQIRSEALHKAISPCLRPAPANIPQSKADISSLCLSTHDIPWGWPWWCCCLISSCLVRAATWSQSILIMLTCAELPKAAVAPGTSDKCIISMA